MDLRVLFVGLGSIGQRHLRNLNALLGPALSVSAYRTGRSDAILTDDLQVRSPQGLVREFDVAVYDNLDESLRAGADIVFVTNPTSLHLPVALKAARAGCHLFIEKPLSHTWDEVESLIAAVEQANLVGYVGFQFRFHPAFSLVKARLSEGAIGNPVAAHIQVGEYMPGFHPYEDYRASYAARKDLGGGVILSQVHELDLLYALFGLPESVYSVGGRLSSLEIDVEDVASTILRFVRGDGIAFPVHLHQDFLQKPAERSWQIIGERGKICWDVSGGDVTRFGASGDILETRSFRNYARNEMFIAELRHFIECVNGDSAPLVSVREGAQSLRIALAAKESLRTGRVIELEEVTVS
jgi:predicted dehydrogenase